VMRYRPWTAVLGGGMSAAGVLLGLALAIYRR
jgi:hypothetical protein